MENHMVGWHHRLNGHASKQTLEDFEGQGNLVCGEDSGESLELQGDQTSQLGNQS